MKIYHNPRCSKSRKTLEIIENAGVSPRVVRYLEEPPGADRIRELAATIGVPVSDLLRRNEDEFRNATDLPDLGDDSALARWLTAAHHRCRFGVPARISPPSGVIAR